MRCSKLSFWILAAWTCHAAARPEVRSLRLRQESTQFDNAPNSVTSDGGRPTSGPTLGQQDESSSSTTGNGSASSPTEQDLSTDSPTTTKIPSNFSAVPSRTTLPDSSTTQEATVATTTNPATEPVSLPIQPRITPAFGVAGVILILTGAAYTLVGIKHRFVQVFLSNGYLAALSVTVLIDYVMKPPIGDAIQGAFLVAISLTGFLYGGGSLIFKEVTEGFGCLLGGFCLSMWLLCLKPGGLVVGQAGKAVMIGVFCVVVWSLSFSHHTREYGLIGATSFAGATAFVLGVDCFSQAGLKEFWFYIWELNDDLFPLDTETYPMTRGIIVELIVIILLTTIGILSQIKLWRIVRERRDRRKAVKLEDERRREVVEEAIGRHLERQNDRDRPTWEKQYGNNLSAKRSTILWSEAHPDKAVTHITPIEDKLMSSSVEALEMLRVPNEKSRAKYSANSFRQSTVTVDTIPEEQEDTLTEKRTPIERLKALTALDPAVPTLPADTSAPIKAGVDEEDGQLKEESSKNDPNESIEAGPEFVPLPFKVPRRTQSRDFGALSRKSDETQDSKLLQWPQRVSTPGSKRASLASILSSSSRLSIASDHPLPSESVENLVMPSPQSSRASSVAATLDEQDRLSLSEREELAADSTPKPPADVIATFEVTGGVSQHGLSPKVDPKDRPQTPSEASFDFEEDPEALSRPALLGETMSPSPSASTVSGDTGPLGSEGSETRHTTPQSSLAEGLTPSALEQIPKQTSHVVLSFRTNEWAKHIADAEEPPCTDPTQMSEDDSEAPTRLASTAAAVDHVKTLTASTTSPSPPVSLADRDGITAVVPEPGRTRSRGLVTPTGSVATSGPSIRPSLRGKRSSTLNLKNSFIGEPIDEDSVSQFPGPTGRQSPTQELRRPKSPPAGPNRLSVTASATSITALMQGSPQGALAQPHPYMVNRSSSYTDVSYQPDPRIRSHSSLGHSQDHRRISRSSSMMSGVKLPVRSETRLDSYDSRQPISRDEAQERQRRESRLTEWRLSQQQGGLITQIPQDSVQQRRAQMLIEREHKRLMEDQQKANMQHQQMAMAQVMRRPEMQDAHREAMRRMQASANKKLRNE